MQIHGFRWRQAVIGAGPLRNEQQNAGHAYLNKKRSIERSYDKTYPLCGDRCVPNATRSRVKTSAGQCLPTSARCHVLGKKRALNPAPLKKAMTSSALRRWVPFDDFTGSCQCVASQESVIVSCTGAGDTQG